MENPRTRAQYRKRPKTKRRVNTTVPVALYDRVLELEAKGRYLSFSELFTAALAREVERLESLSIG